MKMELICIWDRKENIDYQIRFGTLRRLLWIWFPQHVTCVLLIIPHSSSYLNLKEITTPTTRSKLNYIKIGNWQPFIMLDFTSESIMMSSINGYDLIDFKLSQSVEVVKQK